MSTLHLGVLVHPYEKYSKGQTTGDVAEILEDKYGIMQTWWNLHGQEVADKMADGVQAATDALMENRPRLENPFNAAMDYAENSFKTFLSSMEAERSGIPGTPTKAALKGVSHRKAHPYRKANPRRPSFIDSGLYEASFKAWLTQWLR